MKAKKKPSGVRHLLNYLEGSKGPQDKKKEKELLLKEYQSGVISLKEYQKKLEELVMK
jgi:hypothetical protein